MTIKIDNMKKTFKNFTFGPINMELESGTMVAVVGENGSGKTTLFKCLGGLYDFEGKVCVDRNELVYGQEYTACYCSDKVILPLHLTLKDFIKIYGNNNDKFSSGLFKKYLDIFNLDTGTQMRKMRAGQQILIQICFAMACCFPVLLIDEPVGKLIYEEQRNLYKVLKEYAGQNRYVIISTHILGAIEFFCDYLYFIKRGKIALAVAVVNDSSNTYIENGKLSFKAMPAYVDIEGDISNAMDLFYLMLEQVAKK